MSSAALLFLCLFLFSSSSKCLFHFPLLCFLSPIMFPFVPLHRSVSGLYQSFSFFTVLYACLWLLSLNSYSTAINCWLITCLFFLLHAVCADFLLFSYSALFCACQSSENMLGMSYFFAPAVDCILHQTIPCYPFSFTYSPVCHLLCFSFLLICCHCISRCRFIFFLLLLLLSRAYLTSFRIHPRLCPCVAVPFLFSLDVLCRLCFPIIA